MCPFDVEREVDHRMIVGIPREIKDRENRVSSTPAGVAEFVSHGHSVLVECDAGTGSGFANSEYEAGGCEASQLAREGLCGIGHDRQGQGADTERVRLLKPDQLLFTYLHLAAEEKLTRALMERKVQAVAYETVQLANGSLPLVDADERNRGRMSVQVGAHYLERTYGGEGLLLGGVAGVPGAEVVVVGGGVVGTNAAQMALGMGANVTIVDKNVDRLRFLDQVLHGRSHTLASNARNLHEMIGKADFVVGGVFCPARRRRSWSPGR